MTLASERSQKWEIKYRISVFFWTLLILFKTLPIKKAYVLTTLVKSEEFSKTFRIKFCHAVDLKRSPGQSDWSPH